MENRKKQEKPAVGYLRVSTTKQGESGVGFDGQRAAIEVHAGLNGLRIVDWYQEVASSKGIFDAVKRDGLVRALESSRRLRAPLIVSGLDRIARDTRVTEQIVVQGDVAVLSADGCTMTPHSIRSQAARDEAEGLAISQRTKEALQRKKAEGVRLGNPTNLDEASRAGAAANRNRALAKAEEIADHLQALNGHESMSAAEIADSLNASRILSGSGRAWTSAAIRRPLAAAKRILEERKSGNTALRELPNFGRFS